VVFSSIGSERKLALSAGVHTCWSNLWVTCLCDPLQGVPCDLYNTSMHCDLSLVYLKRWYIGTLPERASYRCNTDLSISPETFAHSHPPLAPHRERSIPVQMKQCLSLGAPLFKLQKLAEGWGSVSHLASDRVGGVRVTMQQSLGLCVSSKDVKHFL
jgi:hypothetical protein